MSLIGTTDAADSQVSLMAMPRNKERKADTVVGGDVLQISTTLSRPLRQHFILTKAEAGLTANS